MASTKEAVFVFRGLAAAARRLVQCTTFVPALAIGAAVELPEEDPVTLEPLWVIASRDIELSPLATHTPLPRGGPGLANVLGHVPGVLVQESFGGFDPPRLSVRGSGLQSAPSSRGVALSLFGLPLNAADGSFNLALIESEWLGSADAIRGTAAGVPALGGQLAFSPDPFLPGGRLAARYGSDDAFAFQARAARETETWNFVGRMAHTSSTGWRSWSDQRRQSFHGAARTQTGEHGDVTIQMLAAAPRHEIPGPLTKGEALHTPRINSAAVRRDRPLRDTRAIHLNASTNQRTESLLLRAAVGTSYTDDYFRQLLPNGISDLEAREAYMQFSAQHESEDQRRRTTFAALIQSGWWDMRRYRNNRGEMGALIGDFRLRPTTLTASLDHRLAIGDQQRIDIGASLLGAERKVVDRLASGIDAGFHGAKAAPRAAWTLLLAPEISLTASWSRAFEAPTYGDLIETTGIPPQLRANNLDWQRADTIEVGCQGRHRNWAWSAAAYHAPWRNELLRLSDASGAARGTVNACETRHRGIELGLQTQLLDHADYEFTLGTTYTYSEARFDNDPVYGDRRIAAIPPHLGAVTLHASIPGGWFAAPTCSWRSGRTFADHSNTLSYSGHAIWSLQVGRKHPSGWSATLGIDNLFDRSSIASTAGALDRAGPSASTAIFLPTPPRTFSLQIEYEW